MHVRTEHPRLHELAYFALAYLLFFVAAVLVSTAFSWDHLKFQGPLDNAMFLLVIFALPLTVASTVGYAVGRWFPTSHTADSRGSQRRLAIVSAGLSVIGVVLLDIIAFGPPERSWALLLLNAWAFGIGPLVLARVARGVSSSALPGNEA